MNKVYIGTSGFYYKDWLTKFYPHSLKRDQLLSYYSIQFKTVEINSSFYHVPLNKTVKHWKESTPDDFIFVFKASRYITHIKKLIYDETSWQKFFSAMEPFATAEKKHLILFQLPANLSCHLDRLELILQKTPPIFAYVFEFRHESWFTEEVYEICKKYNVAIVLSDSPVKRNNIRTWPYIDIDTASFSYIRFHGSKTMYASSYTDDELRYYRDLIQSKLQKGLDVYCYFNNDIQGHAVENAKRLKEFMLGRSH